MRRALAAATLAALATVLIGGLAPANAVCGGGEPGEPCQCEWPLDKFITLYC